MYLETLADVANELINIRGTRSSLAPVYALNSIVNSQGGEKRRGAQALTESLPL